MKKNNSIVLMLALLLTAGLFSLAAAIAWLAMQNRSQLALSNVTSPSPSPSTTPTQKGSTPRNLESVVLKSDRNVDYSQLREYLRQQNWKAADRETYLRMLDAAGPLAQATGMTPQSEMDTLSCTDLRTIDQLWHTAAKGQQGFTMQMSVFKAVGFDYRKMYDAIGWQKLPPSNTWAFERTYNTKTRRMEFVARKEPNYTNPPAGYLPTVEIGYNLDVAFSGALRRCAF